MSQWGVLSEVGRLRRVLVHQPGNEHRQTVPWNKDALLFDDVMDLEEARPQHKSFSGLLHRHDVDVLYLEDLLKDVWAQVGQREAFCREVLGDDVLARIGLDHLDAHHMIAGYPDHYRLDVEDELAPLPNLYFTRDPAFAVPGAIVAAHPFWPARRREARLVLAILRRHPLFQGALVYDGLLNDPAATIEGGDVHVADERTVIVGIGERTNEAGAEHLARFLFARTGVDRVAMFYIPAQRAFMHLDTVITFVDRRRALTMPCLWDGSGLYARIAAKSARQVDSLGAVYTGPTSEQMSAPGRLEVVRKDGRRESFQNPLEGLGSLGLIDPERTIYVAGPSHHYKAPEEHVVEALREQWNDAANALAVKPGQVLGYRRNDRTTRALEDEGIEVLAFVGGELVRGRGGARCMSLPLVRDGI